VKLRAISPHVVILVPGALGLLCVSVIDNQVNFAARQRFNTLFAGHLVKIDKPEKVAVIGDRQGLHPELHCAVHQPVYSASPVQQAVIGMNVQVDKFLVAQSHTSSIQTTTGLIKNEITELFTYSQCGSVAENRSCYRRNKLNRKTVVMAVRLRMAVAVV